MPQVYLDYAATSYPKPEPVYQAMDRFLRHTGANPGRGGYELSRQAGRAVLSAREQVAALFNVSRSNQVVFTCNITHALNTAIKGLVRPGDHVLTTSMEHNAVARPLVQLQRDGITFTACQASPAGVVDPADIRRAIQPNTRLVVITHSSNVTGAVQPVREIATIARSRGCWVVLDAAQTAGLLPIDFCDLGVDVLAFTGHKHMLGPMGTGGMVVTPAAAAAMQPLVEGGTGSLSDLDVQPGFLPDKFESGTLNAPGLAGLAAAVELIREAGVANLAQRERELTSLLYGGLQELPGVRVYGPEPSQPRTGVVSITVEEWDTAEISHALDERFGIMTRPGLHCAPWAHRTIGTFPGGTLRFSLGFHTTRDEVEYTLASLHSLLSR